MATTEIVYKTYDNANVVAFSEDNVAMSFAAVTRVVLKLYSRSEVLQHTEDSNTSPSLLSWASNEITFNLGGISLSVGDYLAQVVIYDSSNPNGKVIAHPQSQDDLLIFKFVTA